MPCARTVTLGLALLMFARAAGTQMPRADVVCRASPAPSASVARQIELDASVARQPDRRVVVTADTIIELRQLLMIRSFAELERRLARYDSAAKADVRNEDAWVAAYAAFFTPIPFLESRLDAWVMASPQSQIARVARARYRVSHYVAARGSRFGFVAPDTGRDVAERWAGLVWDDLEKLFDRPVSHQQAYLILGVLAQGRPEGLRALDRALANSPHSVLIRERYSWSLRPRWGGSLDTMRALANASQRFVRANPRLRALLGYPLWEEGYVLREEGDTLAALAKFEEALAYGDAADFRFQRAEMFYELRRRGPAILDLDCALALAPWRTDALAKRGLIKMLIGSRLMGPRGVAMQRDALADIRLARRLNPHDRELQWVLSVVGPYVMSPFSWP